MDLSFIGSLELSVDSWLIKSSSIPSKTKLATPHPSRRCILACDEDLNVSLWHSTTKHSLWESSMGHIVKESMLNDASLRRKSSTSNMLDVSAHQTNKDDDTLLSLRKRMNFRASGGFQTRAIQRSHTSSKSGHEDKVSIAAALQAVGEFKTVDFADHDYIFHYGGLLLLSESPHDHSHRLCFLFDNALILWDWKAHTGQVFKASDYFSKKRLCCVEWLSSRYVAVGCSDGIVRILDCQDRRIVSSLSAPGQVGRVEITALKVVPFHAVASASSSSNAAGDDESDKKSVAESTITATTTNLDPTDKQRLRLLSAGSDGTVSCWVLYFDSLQCLFVDGTELPVSRFAETVISRPTRTMFLIDYDLQTISIPASEALVRVWDIAALFDRRPARKTRQASLSKRLSFNMSMGSGMTIPSSAQAAPQSSTSASGLPPKQRGSLFGAFRSKQQQPVVAAPPSPQQQLQQQFFANDDSSSTQGNYNASVSTAFIPTVACLHSIKLGKMFPPSLQRLVGLTHLPWMAAMGTSLQILWCKGDSLALVQCRAAVMTAQQAEESEKGSTISSAPGTAVAGSNNAKALRLELVKEFTGLKKVLDRWLQQQHAQTNHDDENNNHGKEKDKITELKVYSAVTIPMSTYRDPSEYDHSQSMKIYLATSCGPVVMSLRPSLPPVGPGLVIASLADRNVMLSVRATDRVLRRMNMPVEDELLCYSPHALIAMAATDNGLQTLTLPDPFAGKDSSLALMQELRPALLLSPCHRFIAVFSGVASSFVVINTATLTIIGSGKALQLAWLSLGPKPDNGSSVAYLLAVRPPESAVENSVKEKRAKRLSSFTGSMLGGGKKEVVENKPVEPPVLGAWLVKEDGLGTFTPVAANGEAVKGLRLVGTGPVVAVSRVGAESSALCYLDSVMQLQRLGPTLPCIVSITWMQVEDFRWLGAALMSSGSVQLFQLFQSRTSNIIKLATTQTLASLQAPLCQALDSNVTLSASNGDEGLADEEEREDGAWRIAEGTVNKSLRDLQLTLL